MSTIFQAYIMSESGSGFCYMFLQIFCLKKTSLIYKYEFAFGAFADNVTFSNTAKCLFLYFITFF